MTPITVLLAVLFTTQDPSPAAVHAAVERSIKRIEAGLKEYPEHRGCFSCHHQAVGMMSLAAARHRGFAIEGKLVEDATAFSLRTFRNRSAISKGQGVGGDSTGVVYILNAFAAVEYPSDETTAALVEYLIVKQRKDGSWPIAFRGERPPTMGSLFTNAGLAMYALQHYGPAADEMGADARRKRVDAARKRGREWLLANKPSTTEDRVFHLRGLVDADAEAKDIEAARGQLLAEQRKDGSWAQLPSMSGDAYATATALVSLRHAGFDTTNAGYKRGVWYLLATQRNDGAWLVTTRRKPLQVYFDNGDPGGKSQFISFAATNWAALALLETLPKAEPK